MKKLMVIAAFFLIAGIFLCTGIVYSCVLTEKKDGIQPLQELFASLGTLAKNNMEGRIGGEDGVSIKIKDPVTYNLTLISGKKGRIIITVDADIFEGTKMHAKGSYEAEGMVNK